MTILSPAISKDAQTDKKERDTNVTLSIILPQVTHCINRIIYIVVINDQKCISLFEELTLENYVIDFGNTRYTSLFSLLRHDFSCH